MKHGIMAMPDRMRLIMSGTNTHRWWMHLLRVTLAAGALLIVSGKADVVAQQVLDICGCASTPGLTAFVAGDPTTYPPGTSGCSGPCTSGTIVFTTPPDGIFRFSSFNATGGFHIRFSHNSANTPITLLVAGDVLLNSSFGCCYTMDVSGNNATGGSSGGVPGVGGAGGHGGFRGGDGSALGINGFDTGGPGFGPAGGSAGTPTANSTGGTYVGIPEMLSSVGGSGGGGGGGY